MQPKKPIKKRKKFFKLNKSKIQADDSDKCQETGKESPLKPPLFQIEPHLFVSGYQAARDLQLLKDHSIHHVINLTAHRFRNLHQDAVNYSSFVFSDHENFNLTTELGPVLDIIKRHVDAKENILVHCQKGISRAPSVVMAFLIKERGLSYEEALKTIQSKNPESYPNWGFLNHLKNL